MDGQRAWGQERARDLTDVPRAGAEEEEAPHEERDRQQDDHEREGEGAEGPRPVVLVSTGNLEQETRDLWAALDYSNNPATLFSYGGLIARLRPDPVTKQPGVQVLDRDRVRNEVAVRVMCCVESKNLLLEEVYPPPIVIANLMAARTVALPVLQRVVGVPVFSADGRLIQTPGYDEDSGVYYDPQSGLRIPPVAPVPSAKMVRTAVRIIDHMLIDFPFLGPADKAAAYTLLLEPFVREMIVGTTPLHLVDAPESRTGKSLLVWCLAFPFCGTAIAMSGWPSEEPEMRKRITAVLLAGTTFLVFDNIDRPIASGALSAALTMETWSDRIMRVSQMMHAPQRLTWVITGNNPSYSTEMAGRIIPCRLDAKMERPGERDPWSFHHPRLKQWMRLHRPTIIWAALTLVQHWIAEGRPLPDQAPVLGGFEGWTEVMGGVLEAAGITSLLQNRDRLYANVDPQLDLWRDLMLTWWQRYGDDAVTTQQVLDLIGERPLDWDWGPDSTDLDDQAKRVRLGRDLGGPRLEMVHSGLQVRRSDKKRHGAWLWRLHPVGAQAPQRGESREGGEG